MLATLAATTPLIWASILVKALAYAATLLAAGSAIVRLSLGALALDDRVFLARIAVASAFVAGFLSVLRLPLQASFLMGGTLEGAMEPMILGMLAYGPLGISLALRLAGLALILAVLLPGRVAPWIAATGAGLVAASFAFRGHVLGEPRLVLGTLVFLHVLGLSFWIGAFAPLARAARRRPPEEAGALAQEFGTRALWVVGALVAAGGLTLVFFGVVSTKGLVSPYGQAFMLKLALFAGVLALAAHNRMHLTPDLLAAVPGARRRLRRSIGLEAFLVAGVLFTTAALTSIASPP